MAAEAGGVDAEEGVVGEMRSLNALIVSGRWLKREQIAMWYGEAYSKGNKSVPEMNLVAEPCPCATHIPVPADLDSRFPAIRFQTRVSMSASPFKRQPLTPSFPHTLNETLQTCSLASPSLSSSTPPPKNSKNGRASRVQGISCRPLGLGHRYRDLVREPGHDPHCLAW